MHKVEIKRCKNNSYTVMQRDDDNSDYETYINNYLDIYVIYFYRAR